MKTVLILSLFLCFWSQAQDILLPESTTGQVIHHSYYSLSYSEDHEQAEWVAYRLNPEMVLGTQSRTNDFREDPYVDTGSAGPQDYRSSGYDRGHLAPAGDMKLNLESMSESFYMSNMSPQRPGFNRGIWRRLEEKVRSWVLERECDCYVVTGSILFNGLEKIPGTDISIPDYYYKIVIDTNPESFNVLAFLMYNEYSDENFDTFAVSINDIEEMTGVDFFSAYDDDFEDYFESLVGSFEFMPSSLY